MTSPEAPPSCPGARHAAPRDGRPPEWGTPSPPHRAGQLAGRRYPRAGCGAARRLRLSTMGLAPNPDPHEVAAA